MNDLLPFYRRLSKLGFKRDGRTMEKEQLLYIKREGDRLFDVQLFREGKHRMSHFLKGRMCTHPTSFETIYEMELAIILETIRTDHPPIEFNDSVKRQTNSEESVITYRIAEEFLRSLKIGWTFEHIQKLQSLLEKIGKIDR